MVYIDASFYLSLLNVRDQNHHQAKKLAQKFSQEQVVTSQIIIGEVLTVGSMRIDKKLTIEFVDQIFQSDTRIILEQPDLIKQAYQMFKQIKSKNISWADCFSFALIKKFKIEEVLSFDIDFNKYQHLHQAKN